MSLAKPLVVAFSQNQLAAPVAERINIVESALLYLRREGVPALHDGDTLETRPLAEELTPFLSPSFYDVADPKRAALNDGEVEIKIGRYGLHEAGYILSGQIVTVELNPEQQQVVAELGFDLRKAHSPEQAYCM